MSNEFVLKVIEALESIKTERVEPDVGVCWNLGNLLELNLFDNTAYGLISYFCVGWKDIVEPNVYPLEDYENHLIGKWEGINLELRIDLINHIINRLKTENVTDEFIWSL